MRKLIDLANRAKEAGDMNIANAVMCYLLIHFFESSTSYGLSLEWETISKSYRQAYYDLVVVVCEGERLCMPAPMLKTEWAIAAIKLAQMVPRRDHKRFPYQGDRLTQLWEELGDSLPRHEVVDAIKSMMVSFDHQVMVVEANMLTFAERRRAMLAVAFPFLDEAVKEGIVSIREDGRVYVCLSRSGKDAWAEISPAGEVEADCLVGSSNLQISELEHWISVLVGSEKAAEAVRNLRS